MTALKKTLLIVDNDEDWLALLEKYLEGQGYGIVAAQDYAGAIKVAELVRPECVIVDLHLGSEDGERVCRYIKASPALKTVPVIILSGQDGLPEGSGCDAFVCKADGVGRLLLALKKVFSVK